MDTILHRVAECGEHKRGNASEAVIVTVGDRKRVTVMDEE